MMKSKITIETDFDNGQPYIKVQECADSDDVRDKLISFFRHRLKATSRWCRIEYPFNDGNQWWYIQPILPEQLPEEIELMKEVLPPVMTEDPELVNVYGNSHAFHDFLKEKGIEFKPNEHFTLVQANVDLFHLGQEFQKYKDENK